MITPKSVHMLIRHFDAIDFAVSRRMNRKRPWSELSLTSLLCDLLDEEVQDEEQLRYTLTDLNRDLAELDGLLNVTITIETHEYNPKMERWITQSDLGFAIEFKDHLLPEQSWTAAWLLQAKRMHPDYRNPLQYSETSRFGSMDSDQHRRIERLQDIVGVPFVHYLLYCPRPSNLETVLQRKLTHLRNCQLSKNIFDFTLGLELYEELGASNSSLAAGIFIAPINNVPTNLRNIHSTILRNCYPLSWFLAFQFVNSPNSDLVNFPSRKLFRGLCKQRRCPSETDAEDWVHGIVIGQSDAIDRLATMFKEVNDDPFPILPPHTLKVNVCVGQDLNPELRRIRQE